jgi:hypothetical protein
MNPALNVQACGVNTDPTKITITAGNYSSYNFLLVPTAFWIFTLIAIITALLSPVYYYFKTLGSLILLIILCIFSICAIIGTAALLYYCTTYFNITDKIQILNNPNLNVDKPNPGATPLCNITYRRNGNASYFITNLSKTGIGFIQFTTFLLLIYLVVFTIYAVYIYIILASGRTIA